MIPALPNEENTLRAMLGMVAQPVYLDIKPGPLTDTERRLFAERLAAVNQELAAERLECRNERTQAENKNLYPKRDGQTSRVWE